MSMNTSCTLPLNLNTTVRCALVKEFSDVCEGGGYVSYTALVTCQDGAYWGLVLGGCVIWLLFLFLFVTVAADAFFSPNIAGIVKHLKISENIAGVTFMALGNGASDVFSSVASVLGADKPKAGLAVGALVGAAVFLTTAVVGAVVLVKPFEIMRRPLMRDLSFNLVTIAFTIFVFLGTTLHLWQTIGFLAIYAVFALVVIFGRVIRQRSLKNKAKRNQQEAEDKQSSPISTINDHGKNDMINNNFIHESTHDEPEWNYEPIIHPGHYLSTSAHGLVTHHSVSDNDTVAKLPDRKPITAVWSDFLTAVNPIDETEWRGNLAERIFAIIKIPVVLTLKLTNPLAGNHWSKALAIVHCFTCPLFANIATQDVSSPSDGWPPLWTISLMVGIIPAILVLVFTNIHQEPRFFHLLATFIGFVMSVLWMYTLANEIVGVIQMVGVVSGLSHELLGLTLLAWSNSLPDMISDVAVARRGFPKMGVSAAFGAPIFNLLLGLGLPFTIATLRSDTPIPIELSSVSKVLLGFFLLSLASSIVMLPAQRFHIRRPYGVYLLVVYAAFIVVVILTEVGVLFGGGGDTV